MGIEDKVYGEKIVQEGTFWDQFEEKANKYGIPWWCDLRRATKLGQIMCGWMYDPKIEEILRGYHKKKLIEIVSKKKGVVLDLGCGAGWLSLELARSGMDVDGYDISKGRIRIAKRYLKDNPFMREFGSVNYQVKDINKLELKKNKYDSVVIWDTLHHVVGIARLMKEIHKSLKPNGTLIIYDHIGLERKNYKIIKILQIFIKVSQYLERMFMAKSSRNKSRIEHGSVDQMWQSPFEDIARNEIVDATKRTFQIKTAETQLCFLGACAARLIMRVPDTLKYWFLYVLKLIDDLFIGVHILRGEYVFIVAKKWETEYE